MGIQERKEREKAHKREVILKAAEKVFFKNGFEKTTMDEIAKKAEYSKGTLYLYYKNKETLYAAIMLRSVDIFIDILEPKIARARGGRAKLTAVKEAYLQFYLKYPKHMKVFLFASNYIQLIQTERNDEVMQAVMEKSEQFEKVITSAIEAAEQDESIKEMEIAGDVATIFQAGGLVLNGIYKNIIDLEDAIKSLGFTPEDAVRLAYGMLKF